MVNVSKFVKDHTPLCVCTLGLALLGHLGYHAVRWIINKCHKTEKVVSVAQKNFGDPSNAASSSNTPNTDRNNPLKQASETPRIKRVFSIEQQQKINIAAENLATNLTSRFSLKLLGYTFNARKEIELATERLSDVNNAEETKIIEEFKVQIEDLMNKHENIKSSIKGYFQSYFEIQISLSLSKNIYFQISDFAPMEWLAKILDNICEDYSLNNNVRDVFNNFFSAKHSFMLTSKLDVLTEKIDEMEYTQKLYPLYKKHQH